MIRTAYCSNASNPDLALIALADIIAVSDRNNRRDDITGALLVSRGRFFQILEGAAVDVDRALRRIEADRRHTDIRIVVREDAPVRLFPGWSMIAARITPTVAPQIDEAIDRCFDDPDSAVAAVVDLVHRQHSA